MNRVNSAIDSYIDRYFSFFLRRPPSSRGYRWKQLFGYALIHHYGTHISHDRRHEHYGTRIQLLFFFFSFFTLVCIKKKTKHINKFKKLWEQFSKSLISRKYHDSILQWLQLVNYSPPGREMEHLCNFLSASIIRCQSGPVF